MNENLRRFCYENRNSIQTQNQYPSQYISRITFTNRTSLPETIAPGIFFVRCVRLFCYYTKIFLLLYKSIKIELQLIKLLKGCVNYEIRFKF